MAADVPNWVFSLFASISFIIVLIPFPWHLEAWNAGTCMFIIWTAVSSLNLFINSVVWNSDVINRAPVWCDISTQIMLASSVAIPASCLCISRRLYKIASTQSVTTTWSQKRRDAMVDLAIGLGIPILQLALHPIVQSYRFIIYEEIGCFFSTSNSLPAYFITTIWPVIIGLVSASYSVRTLRQLSIRRAQFKELLSANRNLSSNRYFRLMGISCVDMVFTVPLGCISIYLNLTGDPLQPWKSWHSSHINISMVLQIPANEWHMNSTEVVGLEMSRWMTVLCAFVFFAFFGFADEARRNYRLACTAVGKRVGFSTGTWTTNGSTSPDMSYNSGSATMPVYITQSTEKKRDSLTSFSSRMSLPDVGGALADLKREEPLPLSTMLPEAMSKDSLSSAPVGLDSVPLPALPEATLDMSSPPPRYMPDVAMHDLT